MKSIFKNSIIAAAFVFGAVGISNAQVKVGDNPATINPSAALEIESTNKGFLPSRVALTGLTDVATIPSPADGLVVYNTATAGTGDQAIVPGLHIFENGAWKKIINGDNGIDDNSGSKVYKAKFRGRNENGAGYPKPTMRIPELNLEWRFAVVSPGNNNLQVRLIKPPVNDIQVFYVGHWAGSPSATYSTTLHGTSVNTLTFTPANYNVWRGIDGNWSTPYNYYYLLATTEIRTDGLSPINYISNLYGLCGYGNGWGAANEPFSLAAEVY